MVYHLVYPHDLVGFGLWEFSIDSISSTRLLFGYDRMLSQLNRKITDLLVAFVAILYVNFNFVSGSKICIPNGLFTSNNVIDCNASSKSYIYVTSHPQPSSDTENRNVNILLSLFERCIFPNPGYTIHSLSREKSCLSASACSLAHSLSQSQQTFLPKLTCYTLKTQPLP